MDNYKIIYAEDNLYIIEEETVRAFLLLGSSKALLIDTGSNITDMKSIVESITDLPVMVVNTHADGDHTNCNQQFDCIHMSPSEYAFYHNNVMRNDHLKPLWDGDVIDLGDRELIAVMNPGHTSGCMTFVDLKGRRIIGGDSIQNGRIFLFGPFRDLLAYVHTMRRMEQFIDKVDYVYPSHAQCPVKSDIIPKLAAGVQAIIDRKITEYVEDEFMGTPIRVFDIGVAKILYEAHKEFFE